MSLGDMARQRPDWAHLNQPQNGYRYSLDALVLAGFAAAFRPRHWADLGTGCGVIAVGLSHMLQGSQGIAVERRQDLLTCARQNCAGRPILLAQGDLRRFPWRKQSLDLIVCNPPFYKVGQGLINKDPGRAEARHAFFGDLPQWIKTTLPALRAKGRICFVFPIDLLPPVLKSCRAMGLSVDHSLAFRAHPNAKARLTCVALALDKTIQRPPADMLTIESPTGAADPRWRSFLSGCPL